VRVECDPALYDNVKLDVVKKKYILHQKTAISVKEKGV